MAKQRSLADRINRLPLWARDYIMRIQTEADPAGTQRLLIEQQELIRQLTAKIAELKGVRYRRNREFEMNGRAPGVRRARGLRTGSAKTLMQTGKTYEFEKSLLNGLNQTNSR
jgi:hypothetical protein